MRSRSYSTPLRRLLARLVAAGATLILSGALTAAPASAAGRGCTTSKTRVRHTTRRGRTACGVGTSKSHARTPSARTPSIPPPILKAHPSGPHPIPTPGGVGPGSPAPPPAGEPVKEDKRHPHEGGGGGGLPQDENGVVTDPIDPRFLTKDPFGASSFWIQPWRAYLDTWPSSTLLSSLGINFNVHIDEADAVAQLLQDSGFRLARREIPWGDISYEHPTQLVNEAKVITVLEALKRHNLRPLILLNGNSGQPTPGKLVTLTTLAPALPGAMTVRLSPASAAEVVPGKTGFDGLTWGEGPDVLIASVNPEGVATLSRPLRATLPAGPHRAMTLRYAPFQNPKLPNGAPNPVFQETLAGWLSYVGVVNNLATRVLGPGGYDLEVWNELTFGSQFLNSEHYYQPPDSRTEEAEKAVEPQDLALAPEDAETPDSPETRQNATAMETSEAETSGGEGGVSRSVARTRSGASAEGECEAGEEGAECHDNTKTVINVKVTHAVTNWLLKETVAYVRNPANGISPNVAITDGFASQTPFPSGALSPVGLTALSKHLYASPRQFPSGYPENKVRPLNALGVRDTLEMKGFKPLFIPTFQSAFPEYSLSALGTETIVRDIAPITTEIYGLKHGREVGPAGGSPVQKWMTEYNLGTGKGTVMGPDGATPANVALTPADRSHFEAKALLRSLVAEVNKGMSREYFFAAGPGPLSLINKAFYEELEAHPETYPGDQLGGETMSGFRDLFAHFQGPGPTGQARQLKLLSISQEGEHAQFNGDGTAAHPSLYDRDVLAVLPFQSSPTRFVIPVYVMTRDLLTLYEPGQPASDVNRFDLPAENFRITLANLPESSEPPEVSAYDPLRHSATPARLLSRHGESAEFEIAATDYPRLLTLQFH